MKSDGIIWERYFILRATHCDCNQTLASMVDNNEVYLSSNVELHSPRDMAHLETRSLAERYKASCIKRLRKRYGDVFDLNIVECSTRQNQTIQQRIKLDSGKIKQRLTIRNMKRQD